LPAQLQLKTPVWPQNLHALIPPVSYIDVTLGVHRHTRWPVELALALSGHPKAGHELPLRGEFLDTVVTPVGHIHITLSVHTDAGGTRRVAPVPHENAPISAHGRIVGVGETASVVPIVHYPDGLDILQRYTRRSNLRAHCSPLFKPVISG